MSELFNRANNIKRSLKKEEKNDINWLALDKCIYNSADSNMSLFYCLQECFFEKNECGNNNTFCRYFNFEFHVRAIVSGLLFPGCNVYISCVRKRIFFLYEKQVTRGLSK